MTLFARRASAFVLVTGLWTSHFCAYGETAVTNSESRLKRLASSYAANSANLSKIARNFAGGSLNIGTSNSVVDAERHQCHALALLLGKDETARRIAVQYQPNLQLRTTENAQDVAIAAHSMYVFTQVVDEIIAWDAKQRREEWNLGCVGSHGIRNEDAVGGSPESFFRIRRDGSNLVVLGAVEAGFFIKLKGALEKTPTIRTVALGSNGGAVHEALLAGRYIRQRGLNTELWNNCRSACVLVFLGGAERRIDAPYPALGFHQISLNGVAVSAADAAYLHVASYAEEMGVDSTALMRLMQLRPPSGMLDIKYEHNGVSDLLCKYRIATVVQRGCSLEDFRTKPPVRSRIEPKLTERGGSNDSPASQSDPFSLDYDPLAPGAYRRYLQSN